MMLLVNGAVLKLDTEDLFSLIASARVRDMLLLLICITVPVCYVMSAVRTV